MSAGQRPKSPAGRRNDDSGDVEVPTDQGPPGDELTSRTYEEPELPGVEKKKEKSEPRPVAPDPNPGDVVGDYELLEKLGKGGAGSVFRAKKRSDGSIVALKVLAAQRAKRARIVQRFFDEVRAAQAVQHPGLIRVLDFIEEEEPRRLAYAMEFVAGETLRERLKKEGAMDLREAIHIGAEVAGALTALHDAGIIHRDLKPENIMLIANPTPATSTTGGIALPRVKLLDFGVVKFLPFDRSGSSASSYSDEKKGTFVGTPRYMAPEQAAGGVVDPRADLFSIGVLLFEMITGRCPHEGDSLRDVVMAKLKGAPRVTVNPGKEILPQELTEIVDACLKLKPALRPKDARTVQRALLDAEAVLFVVGPVKQDERGSFSRPTSSLGSAPVSDPHTITPALGNPRPLIPTPPPQTTTPAPQLTSPGLDARARQTNEARKIAFVMLAVAILIVLGVLGAHFMTEDEATLILPLDPPKADTADTATTASSTTGR